MDVGLATFLSGALAGVIGGTAGVLSAVLSYRIARAQLEHQEREERARQAFEVILDVAPKRLEAAEFLWKYIFEIERGTTITEASMKDLVGALMWLPGGLRTQCLELVTLCAGGKPQNAEDVKERVKSIRESLIEMTGIKEIERLGVERRNAR